MISRPSSLARSILVIDLGGTHVKILASGQATPRRADSGPEMTPAQMATAVQTLAEGWSYDVIALGYPGPVLHGKPVAEPAHLASGWVAFDYRAAFGKPIRIVNDAAMQALGSYRGGRMLFLGLGTGLGSALIVDGVLEPMELGHLPYKSGKTYEDYLGARGLLRRGKKKWRASVADVTEHLRVAVQADEVVLGGGEVKRLKELPPGARLGDNANAFAGGFALWQERVVAKVDGAADLEVVPKTSKRSTRES